VGLWPVFSRHHGANRRAVDGCARQVELATPAQFCQQRFVHTLPDLCLLPSAEGATLRLRPCHTTLRAGPHWAVREVEVMSRGMSTRSKYARISTLFCSLPLLRHQRQLLTATCCCDRSMSSQRTQFPVDSPAMAPMFKLNGA